MIRELWQCIIAAVVFYVSFIAIIHVMAGLGMIG